jgi:hypothetical protein
MILLHILWPTFALVLLIFVVVIILAAQRMGHLKTTPPAREDFTSKASTTRYFEPVQLPADNLANLFETPVLFFAIVPLLMGTQQAGIAQVALAWIFVLLRVAHSWIHLSVRNVRARFQVFAASIAVLAAMWIGFFIDFASAAAVYAEAVAQP